jgi:hypothetical protein
MLIRKSVVNWRILSEALNRQLLLAQGWRRGQFVTKVKEALGELAARC